MVKVGKLGHASGAHHGRYMHHNFKPQPYIEQYPVESLSTLECGLILPFLIRSRYHKETSKELEVKYCTDIIDECIKIKNKVSKLSRAERDNIENKVSNFKKTNNFYVYDGDQHIPAILGNFDIKHTFEISANLFKAKQEKFNYIVRKYKPTLIILKTNYILLIYT